MDPDTLLEMEAELFHAMGNASRLKIVYMLQNGPQCVSDLAKDMGLSQPAVSRHLAALRRPGVVIAQRHAQEVLYQLANPKIVAVCNLMREVLSERIAHSSEIAQAFPDTT
jgi:DNA-binding transcriptional ArsR family regulator